jgi:hypothetical protein
MATTIEFHRDAAAAARAARDVAEDDGVRLDHDRAWAAHMTAMRHLQLVPHYVAQAEGARRYARRILADLGRLRPYPGRAEDRAKIVKDLALMERHPFAHREHAQKWADIAADHTAAALKKLELPPKADEIEPEAGADKE